MTTTINVLVEALEAALDFADGWKELSWCAPARAALDRARAEQAEPVKQPCGEYLCRAWGETERPSAQIVPDMAGVRDFMVREWLGADDAPELPGLIAEIEARDWRDEGEWVAQFEIGGVSVELVDCYTTPPAAPAKLEQRSPLEQFDLDQSEDYRKGYQDGRLKGFEVGQRHAIEAARNAKLGGGR